MGLRSCYVCHGKGWNREDGISVEVCQACRGKGKVQCIPIASKPPCSNGCGKLTNHMSGICQPCRSLTCKCGKSVAPNCNVNRVNCYKCHRRLENKVKGTGQWLSE